MAYTDVMHSQECPKHGLKAEQRRDPRGCRCAPSVRAQVARVWVIKGAAMTKGWTKADLRQLEREAEDKRGDHESGRRVIRRESAPLLRDLAEPWLKEVEDGVALGDYAPNTATTYRSLWRAILEPELGDAIVNPEHLDAARVRALRAKLLSDGRSRNYVTAILSLLSSILADSAIPRWLPSNPCEARGRRKRGSRSTAEVREPRALDMGFVHTMLAHALRVSPLLHDMILCAATTGMRQRELAGLKWSHIDFKRRRITIANQLYRQRWDTLPKSQQPRVIEAVLCQALADRLAARAEHATSEYVFAAERTGQPWSPTRQNNVLNAVWDDVGDRAKGESWHVLRHTFATLLDQHRIRPLLIDALMGHRNSGVPFRYKHVLENELGEVEVVLDAAFPATSTVPESAEVAEAGKR